MADETETPEVPPPPPPPPPPPLKRSYLQRCLDVFRYTPKAIYFLLVNITLENFASYGILTVVMIYFKEELNLPESFAKNIYHVVQFSGIAFPVIGSILADMFLGKFLLIVPLDWLWMIVCTCLSLSSYTPFGLNNRQQRDIAIACLLLSKLRGLATPSVVAFPGDQYDETATKARDNFYYALYLVINLGSSLGILLVPRIRSDVHCIPDSENCFPAAFGFPVGVSLIATCFLFGGYPFYKLLPAARVQNWKLIKCFFHGIARLCRSWFRHKENHWMDLAKDKYDEKDIAEVKAILGVTVVFTAYPMFWALFDQQPSLWTMMSSRLDGRTVVGQILPDQMDAANPIIVMLLIPLFAIVLYPLLAKIKMLRTPLERIGCGYILGAFSYIVAGIICLLIEHNMPAYPDFESTDIVFHNGLTCDIKINFNKEHFAVPKYKSVQVTGIALPKNSKNKHLDGIVKVEKKGCSQSDIPDLNFTAIASAGHAYSILIKSDLEEDASLTYEQGRQNRSRDDQRNSPKVRLIYVGNDTKGREIAFFSPGLKACYPLTRTLNDETVYNSANVLNDQTKICYHNKRSKKKKSECTCDKAIDHYKFARGGIYDMMIIDKGEKTQISVFVTAEPDSVPILLQLLMYLLITMGEIMCSVTAYSFAYSESPETTKSIMQAILYVFVSLGNLIVLVVDNILKAIAKEISSPDPERPKYIPAPSTSFFVYSALMFMDVLYFVSLARRYKYVNPVYQNIKK